MTSLLTQAIHLALLDCGYPHNLTAQGVAAVVRRNIPGTSHATVKAEIERLIALGAITIIRKPHLPARYKYRRGTR